MKMKIRRKNSHNLYIIATGDTGDAVAPLNGIGEHTNMNS